MFKSIVHRLVAFLVALEAQVRRPQPVRVDDRHGLLRRCEHGGLGLWVGVDFGDGRTAWFPAEQVTYLTTGGRR